MDTEHPESAALAPSLDNVLNAAGTQLDEAEKQVAAVAKALRRLRRAAQEGAVSGLAAAAAAAAQAAAQAAEPLSRAAAALDYDVAAAFESGAWLHELTAAAAAAGLVLVQRDGRITSYPVVLRLDAKAQGVRLGRRLERRIGPAFLAAHLKRLQARPNRFNARAFLDRLLKPYALLARAEDPGWRANQPGTGPLLALADLHETLTLLPAAAADYPLEEFVCDLLRLDRTPDASSAAGHRFELRGATGKKGAKRLTLFDEAGVQHDYYAIRFSRDVP